MLLLFIYFYFLFSLTTMVIAAKYQEVKYSLLFVLDKKAISSNERCACIDSDKCAASVDRVRRSFVCD